MSEPSAGEARNVQFPWSEVPDGWKVVDTWGPPLFVTHALLERPDGSRVEWNSRRNRKRLGLRPVGDRPLAGLERRWGARPSPVSLWMGGLFMIGSLCFALGSLPLYFDHVDPELTAYTFFVGSIFFTSAAYLQYHESLAAPLAVTGGAGPSGLLASLVGWKPHRIDWWASGIQLIGTVFFNVSTFAGTRSNLDLDQQKELIWAPDVLGSICFLVASWLAFSEVSPRLWARPATTGWSIAALNLVGSVAFGVAAVAARYLTTTGEPANITLVNLGTFAGAVCFFLGAALLPVESARDAVPEEPG